jgi:hypothetical protein
VHDRECDVPAGLLTEPAQPRIDVDRETIRQILATPLDSEAFATDLDAAEAPLDDPWQSD